MYVEEYYELVNRVLLANSIGFNLKNLNVFRYKVLILLKTEHNTYHKINFTYLQQLKE